MSQWVPSPERFTSSQEEEPKNDSSSEVGGAYSADQSNPDPSKPKATAHVPFWVRIFPFCLSAFFFLSAFLVIFSPLPLLFFHIQKGRKWALLATLVNAAIVGLLAGWVSLAFYLVWVVTLSLTLMECLRRKKSIEKSVVYTLAAMAIVGFLLVGGYSQVQHLNPIHEVRNHISSFVDYLGQSVSVDSNLLIPGDIEDWKQSLLLEFPSAMAIFSLVLVWANLVLLIRSSPLWMKEKLGIEPTILKSWKAPEFLVWPTLFAGFFLVVELGVYSDIALNCFKFLMAIYAIQGLSILSYFFDLWGVRGFFRLVGFSLSLFLMMPLLLSLGFFELWFDFRGKFRQS